jgi:hypothetical protein
VASRLLLVVHLGSARTVEPVRQDSSFAEKQKSHPALQFVVQTEHATALRDGDRFRRKRS